MEGAEETSYQTIKAESACVLAASGPPTLLSGRLSAASGAQSFADIAFRDAYASCNFPSPVSWTEAVNLMGTAGPVDVFQTYL